MNTKISVLVIFCVEEIVYLLLYKSAWQYLYAIYIFLNENTGE